MISAISVRGLSHAYRKTQALCDVSVDVPQGSVTAVLGPNGAGKSTLVKYLTGSIKAARGIVTIMGEDAGRASCQVRRLVGVVFQEPTLDRDLTARENVALALMLHGRAWRQARQEADACLGESGLTHLARRRVRTLSGGEFRRVEIVRAMAHRPSIVILDEPTSGLDPVARNQVWEQVSSSRLAHGTSFVFSTHYMDEVGNADQVYLMARGRVEAQGSPEELKATLDTGRIVLNTSDNSRAAMKAASLGLMAELIDGHVNIRCARPETQFLELLPHLDTPLLGVRFIEPSFDEVFRKFDEDHR